MHRVEGWKNPFKAEKGNLHPEAEKEANIYEAGADAMLKGLLKSTIKTYINETDILTINIPIGNRGKCKGWLVFIPEEAV